MTDNYHHWVNGWVTPTIRVKLDDGAFPLMRCHDTDAGADIRTPERVMLHANGSATIHTGVHVELPQGTVGLLKSKSGLNVRDGVVGEGVIDEGYTGEIVVKLYNNSNHPHLFERGDKVIQLLVMPVLYPDFEQVDEIEGGERGDNGFGSTGA